VRPYPLKRQTGEKPITRSGEIDRPAGRDVTRLLDAWSAGDRSALEQLTRLVYAELRRIAHHFMSGQRDGHTLQTTALVNEAYMRLAGQDEPRFANRSHFLAVAAKAMRQILVDHARAAQRDKRGAGVRPVQLDEAAVLSAESTREILDLNEALERLAALDARKASVVEMTYFAGLKQEEIAEALNVSVVTVRRDWAFSRAWLYAELRGTG
jgi:RNA polymerase sigma factor (TIGR02999 family)